MPDAVGIDTATYRRTITDMLKQFHELPELDVQSKNHCVVQIAYGWCAQIHRFAQAIVCLIDGGFGHEAGTVLRSMLEYTITLHWLVQVGDRAVDAVSRRHQASWRAIAGSAKGGAEELIPSELVAELLAHEVPRVDEEETLRHFEAICRELGVDRSLYVVFRFECGLTHPTFGSAAEYFSGDPGSIELLNHPKVQSERAIHMAAHCLVWSGRALDSLLAGRPLRRTLQQVARTIKSAPVLPDRITASRVGRGR